MANNYGSPAVVKSFCHASIKVNAIFAFTGAIDVSHTCRYLTAYVAPL